MLSRRRMSRTSWIGCRSTTAIEATLPCPTASAAGGHSASRSESATFATASTKDSQTIATWGRGSPIFLNIEARLESPPDGHLKLPHPWPGQTPPGQDGGIFVFSSLTAVRQVQRVRSKACVGERWASHGPRRGRPQACPVDGWLVHGGRGRRFSPPASSWPDAARLP